MCKKWKCIRSAVYFKDWHLLFQCGVKLHCQTEPLRIRSSVCFKDWYLLFQCSVKLHCQIESFSALPEGAHASEKPINILKLRNQSGDLEQWHPTMHSLTITNWKAYFRLFETSLVRDYSKSMLILKLAIISNSVFSIVLLICFTVSWLLIAPYSDLHKIERASFPPRIL